MVNHPNRSKRNPSPARSPNGEEVKALRESLGLTEIAAANVIYSTPQVWAAYESGERRMHSGLWELFRIKVGVLPWPPAAD